MAHKRVVKSRRLPAPRIPYCYHIKKNQLAHTNMCWLQPFSLLLVFAFNKMLEHCFSIC